MPRLTDFPVAAKRLGTWCLFKRVYDQMWCDRLTVWAASLAYSWLFALFPFFIFLMTIAALLPFDRQETINQVEHAVSRTLARDAADTVVKNLDAILREQQTGIMSLGLLIAIWAASGGIADTMSALNRCYEVEEDLPFYKARPLAIALTLAITVLILAALVLLPLGAVVTTWLTQASGIAWLEKHNIRLSPAVIWTWEILRWVFGLLLLCAVVATLYHFAPRVRHKFRLFTPGVLFTVACWILLGFGFRYYVEHFGNYGRMYGAVGGVVILLFIFYLDALVLLIGAELDAEIDFTMTAAPISHAEPEVKPDLDVESVQEANEGTSVHPVL